MKLAISDGKEQQEAEVYDHNGHTIVVLGTQTFEFEFPEVEAEIVAFTKDGPLLLLEDELQFIANYRDETIQLFNPSHDKQGRFASKSGAFGLFGKSIESKKFEREQVVGDALINKWLVGNRDDKNVKKVAKQYGKSYIKSHIKSLNSELEWWHKDKKEWHPDTKEQYDALNALHDRVDAWEDIEDDIALVFDDKGEIIQLIGNPFRDAIGQFASSNSLGGKLKAAAGKAKSAAVPFAKQSGKRIAGSAASGAAFGAIGGGIGGAAKGFFKGDPNQGSILAQTKRGLIKGALEGAKKGAIKAVIRSSFGIGSELAGDYGWAVKSVGGLAMSHASRKMNFGLNEKDMAGISKELFVGGFADLASKLLEANVLFLSDVIYLDESKFSRGLAELCYAIADALEQNPDTEGISFDNTPELGSLGFKEENGVWYIEREAAEELLAGLTAYAEVKLESDDEIVKLANPYHDAFGRFATANNLFKASKVVGQVGKVAGIGNWITRSIIDARVNEVYKKQGGPEVGILDYFSSKGRARIGQAKAKRAEIVDQIKSEKVFSKVIAGKNVSVTYGHLQRGSKTLGAISMSASIASGLLWVGGAYKTGQVHSQGREQQRQQAREQAYKDWEEREQRGPQTKSTSHWPPQATAKDFKNMYRKVSMRYHPDTGGSVEQMQKINKAYADKDWFTIESLYTQLEAYLLENSDEFTTEQAETLGLLIRMLKQALDDGAEYIIFPADEDDYEPFVVIDGEMVLDRPTVELIVEAFMGEEDAGTDRPIPSEG